MRRLHSSEAGWKFRSVSGEKNSVQKRKGAGLNNSRWNLSSRAACSRTSLSTPHRY